MAKRKGTAGDGDAQGASTGPKPAYDDWEWVPQAEKEFDKFPIKVRAEMSNLIVRVLNRQTRAGAGDVKHLGRGIYELRDRMGNNHFRVLYFINEHVCVGLTCFYKNQQKTERQDIDRAIGRRSSYVAGR